MDGSHRHRADRLAFRFQSLGYYRIRSSSERPRSPSGIDIPFDRSQQSKENGRPGQHTCAEHRGRDGDPAGVSSGDLEYPQANRLISFFLQRKVDGSFRMESRRVINMDGVIILADDQWNFRAPEDHTLSSSIHKVLYDVFKFVF